MEIPDGVTVRMDGQNIVVKGPHGEVKRTLVRGVSAKVDGKSLTVACDNKAIAFTNESVLGSMLVGASQGYKKNLKFIYAHFPISLEVKGKDVMVKNFLGEKMARKTVLVGNTKVESKGQNVTISGPDKEAVGQTLANIRAAMRIRDRDARIFQDGIYEIAGE